jgi:DNA-binding SARP family transcriptional activator
LAWATWVQLCGGFAVERDGVRIEQRLPGRQGRLTLAYLAANESRWISRDALVFALWREDEPPDADAALASLVSKVRRVVGPELIMGRGSLRFVRDQGTVHVDMHFAADALHRAQVQLAAGEPRLAWQPAHTAYAIAGRRFMEGFEAPWIDDVRESMETLCLNALECEAHALFGVGETLVAETAARKLIQRAPFRESGYQLLMRALDETGNRAEALRVFDKLRCLLSDELGTTPGPEISALHQRLLGAGH